MQRKTKNILDLKKKVWCISKILCFKCKYGKFSISPGKHILPEFMHLEYSYEVESHL